VSGAARRGVNSCACIEGAHGNDLLLLPDLEGEGAGSLVEDRVGAVIEGEPCRRADPDKGGAEEISRELAGQQLT
jgi:hypothetical protein